MATVTLAAGLALGAGACGSNSGNGDSVGTNAVHPTPTRSEPCSSESSLGTTTDCNAAVTPPPPVPSQTASTGSHHTCQGHAKAKHHRHCRAKH